MRIVLIGYGKMGKTIHRLAEKQGHQVVHTIDANNLEDLKNIDSWTPDVAIEFTNPKSAVKNILSLIAHDIPVVCGTTGWLQDWNEVQRALNHSNTGFFYASNYSIGVNIFFHLNLHLAKLMNGRHRYKAGIKEIHHLQKLDSPSGTAITLAEGIINEHDSYESWMEAKSTKSVLGIEAIREEGIFGIHEIAYTSQIDTITIQHEAHSRDGFASGAIMAAEWIQGKKGIFGMKDLLAL